MQKAAILILPLVLPLVFASCNRADAKAAVDARNSARQEPQNALPSSVSSPSVPPVTGAVMETLEAGGYTYVRLKTTGGNVWAAVTQTSLAKGSEITIGDAMWMEQFESKTLNRKFDRILFGAVVANGTALSLPPGHPSPAGGAGLPAPHAGVAEAKGDVLDDVKVERAKGGKTVAEIFASRATLTGAEVVVRGKVVKFNAGIMGRNWIHLRDGSGTADRQDNDITVTTAQVVAKGEIVTVRGKLALDKDFTAGYVYPVIIEDAKVTR